MTASALVPKDDPLMIAWEAHKASPDYANSRNWALHEQHVDGSLWALFVAGWVARGMEARQGRDAQRLDAEGTTARPEGARPEQPAPEQGAEQAVQAEPAGWLIEHSGEMPWQGRAGSISWLCVKLKHAGFGAREFGFTHDAVEALRFSRKEDAEAVLRMYLGIDPPAWYRKQFSVTKHMWPGAALSTSQQEPRK